MITTVASKLWFAVAALATAALALYAFTSDQDWFGGMVLGSVAAAALTLGVLAVAVRDGNVPADEVESNAPVRQSAPAPWPVLGAVGAAVTIVGLAGGNELFYVGLGVLAVVLAEWLVQGWAERATADPVYNQALRHRVMSPIEIPAVSVLVIGVVMISISRVLLAVSKTGSIVVAGVVATVILVVASLLVSRPRLGSSVFAGVLAVAAVATVGAGIVGGIAGEREIEPHHAEEEHHGDEAEEGNNPAEDEGGENQSEPGADPSGADTDGESSDTGGGEVTEPGADSNSTPASTTP